MQFGREVNMTDYDKLKYLHTQINSRLHYDENIGSNTKEILEDALLVINELKESYKGDNMTWRNTNLTEEKTVFGIFSLTSKCDNYIYIGVTEFVAYDDTDVIYDYRLLEAIQLPTEAQIIANASLFESSDIFAYRGGNGRKMLGVSNKKEEAFWVMKNIIDFHRQKGEKIVLNTGALGGKLPHMIKSHHLKK